MFLRIFEFRSDPKLFRPAAPKGTVIDTNQTMPHDYSTHPPEWTLHSAKKEVSGP